MGKLLIITLPTYSSVIVLKEGIEKKNSSTLTITVPVILINKSKLFEMLIEKISLKDELMLSSLTLCG